MKACNVLNLIGNTPLICLDKFSKGTVFGKAEFLNPGGSIKDRIAKAMIEDAEKRGLLKPGGTIILAEGMRRTSLKFAKAMEEHYTVAMKKQSMESDGKEIPVVLFKLKPKP